MTEHATTAESPADDRLLNTRQIKDRIPVSDVTIWRWERDAVLPPAIRIGRYKFWRERDIDALIERAARGVAEK